MNYRANRILGADKNQNLNVSSRKPNRILKVQNKTFMYFKLSLDVARHQRIEGGGEHKEKAKTNDTAMCTAYAYG